jgi:TRAP-type transport system periplasmic protein
MIKFIWEAFGKKVEEYTRGKYKVQIYPSGQLANDPKAIEQLQNGGIDFTVSAAGSYAGLQKTLNLTALPYLVETYEQGWGLYDIAVAEAQFEELPKEGPAAREIPEFPRSYNEISA